MQKFSPLRFLMILMLLVLSGCGRADISEERKDYILAKEHGWIELSVEIAPELIDQTKLNCMLETTINGEHFLTEPLFPAGKPKKLIKTGFLFAIPSEKSEVVLNFSQCQKEPLQTSASLELQADTIVHLNFDGKIITASAAVPYKPITLSGLAKKIVIVETAQNQNQMAVAGELSLILKILIVAVALLGMLLVVSWLKHGKKQA